MEEESSSLKHKGLHEYTNQINISDKKNRENDICSSSQAHTKYLEKKKSFNFLVEAFI